MTFGRRSNGGKQRQRNWRGDHKKTNADDKTGNGRSEQDQTRNNKEQKRGKRQKQKQTTRSQQRDARPRVAETQHYGVAQDTQHRIDPRYQRCPKNISQVSDSEFPRQGWK